MRPPAPCTDIGPTAKTRTENPQAAQCWHHRGLGFLCSSTICPLMTDHTTSAPTSATPVPAATRRPPHPVLEQLGRDHPALFGATVQPLKRGIFQDLMAAYGETMDKAALKTALAIHTRSIRYLQAVASGAPRHDLQGQVVEATAPEHVLHAMLELFKRRKPRPGETPEQQQERLQRRIAQLFADSNLTREAFGACPAQRPCGAGHRGACAGCTGRARRPCRSRGALVCRQRRRQPCGLCADVRHAPAGRATPADPRRAAASAARCSRCRAGRLSRALSRDRGGRW